ncbi:MAG: riboflavin biosynthesis protein RibD, partial [Dehalococcoidia bacterium]|nr:riboflavin biosynthesis protein RibD [Dehalococcoidia bacterium]
DKVLAFIAPIIIGGTGGRTAVGGDGVLTVQDAFNLDSVEVKKFADNVLVSGYVRTAAPISCSVE